MSINLFQNYTFEQLLDDRLLGSQRVFYDRMINIIMPGHTRGEVRLQVTEGQVAEIARMIREDEAIIADKRRLMIKSRDDQAKGTVEYEDRFIHVQPICFVRLRDIIIDRLGLNFEYDIRREFERLLRDHIEQQLISERR